MTKQEIAADLIAGCQKAGGEYITVQREQLLVALGAQPPEEEKETDGQSDEVSG